MSLSHLRLRAPTKTHLTWLARWFSGRRPTTRPRHRLTLERCESRIAPATATLASGVLTIDFTATGTTAESVTLSNDGTNITLTGNVTGATTNPTANVSKIVVQDIGAGSAQSVTFSGSTAYSVADGLQVEGVEFATINTGVSTANAASISISVTMNVTVKASLSTVHGAISLSANLQTPANVGSFSGVNVQNKAVITSTSGAITLRGRDGGVTTISASYAGVGLTDHCIVGFGTTGPVTIEGLSGTGMSIGALLTSGGGDVTVTDLEGVALFAGCTITAGGMGNVVVNGDGGGVALYQGNCKITSSGGSVSVTGRGASSSGGKQYGVSFVQGSSEINAGGMGSVIVEGFGGQSTGSSNYGVLMDYGGSQIKSSGGSVTVRGFGGGSGASGDNVGVYLKSGSSIPPISGSGSGLLAVYGKGGTGSGNGNIGVFVFSNTISTVDASISVVGEGGGSGTSGENYGIRLDGSEIRSDGIGSVTVQGIGGLTSGNNNKGIHNQGGIVSTGGAVVVTGQGGGIGASSGNIGIDNFSSGQIKAGGNGSVDVKAYGGITTGTGSYGIHRGSVSSIGGPVNIAATSETAEAVRQISVSTSGMGGIAIASDSIYSSSFFAGSNNNASLSIRPLTSGTKIDIGGPNVLGSVNRTLGLPTEAFAFSRAGTTYIGDANTGPIILSADISRGTDSKTDLVLTTSSSITLAAKLNYYYDSITLNSAGPITQTSGTIRTFKGTLTLNAPNQTATFSSLGNSAAQLVIPATVTAIVNGSFDSTGFVQVDGTLGGTGSVGITTVSSTGRIKPGSGTPGKLTTGNIAFNAGAVLDVQLNGASYSQLAVNGTVNLGGATLQATTTGPNLGQQYRIVDNLGAGVVTGTFAGYGEGSTYATGSTQYRVSYKDGTGNDVTLTPPAIVSSVVFGDGTNQRSLVKQMIVNFSQPVNFTTDAFKLSRTGSAGVTGSVGLNLNPPIGPTNSVTITFAGALTEFGSLVDGFYDLTLDATKVTNAGGSLDGDANGAFGGNYAVIGGTANKFFRLFGDSSGSGVVDLGDFSALRSVFNLPSAVFDFDNDGVAGLSDFARFRKGYGLSP